MYFSYCGFEKRFLLYWCFKKSWSEESVCATPWLFHSFFANSAYVYFIFEDTPSKLTGPGIQLLSLPQTCHRLRFNDSLTAFNNFSTFSLACKHLLARAVWLCRLATCLSQKTGEGLQLKARHLVCDTFSSVHCIVDDVKKKKGLKMQKHHYILCSTVTVTTQLCTSRIELFVPFALMLKRHSIP